MGNQLVGVAPAQIYPVEHYLIGSYSFESDLQYESSMGSTRFFKVARASSDEGMVVVKVFVKNDPSLPLEEHAKRLESIKKSLANAVNCLPFQRVVLTEKACLIMREYVKHSLYDKVSTRPFLTTLEKKWITFQVLCALHQCHQNKICHGDIKLENILITSWNWILLSDFASFKPTYLPEDNPADYTYFFDTSRRRTCYIAPERFRKRTEKTTEKNTIETGGNAQLSESMINNTSVSDGSNYTGNLLPEMDIFSAGCALLELWSEGTAPFEFSQLLAYRAGEMELVKKHLAGIENVNLRNLIASMISVNPKDRKSAEIYLDQERGRLFPVYFYSFLQLYMQLFSSTPIIPADEKINQLHSHIKNIIKILTEQSIQCENEAELDDDESGIPCNMSSDNEGLIIITTVVTSCIRGLHHCATKLRCLEILQQIAQHTSSETILDRILPYILHLTNDPVARVRVNSLNTLTACLRMVNELPRSDANVFPEYVLPSIASMANDQAVVVRVAYAKNIATLAETAVRFLEHVQLNSPNEMPASRYESELSALHEMLQQTVLSLLTDSHTIVKQTIIESGITKLCVFFGRQKANDLILSHMITFLNDKEDRNLRGSFYDCIVGVAAFVGWQCSDILLPLLQQGLTDVDEFVIAKSIHATTALTELGLVPKAGITEFIAESSCYLNHPNLWIRHEICGLISTTAKIFDPIDVQCKIMPAISDVLKTEIIQVDRPEILLDCLHPPIPRNIFDSVVRFPDVGTLMKVLHQRSLAQYTDLSGKHIEMDYAMKNLFRRLSSEGLTELIESQLLLFKDFFMKLSKYKAAEVRKMPDGKINLEKNSSICHEYVMAEKNHRFDIQIRKSRKSENDNNLDWHHMFSANDTGNSPTTPSIDSSSLAATSNSTASLTNHIPSSSLVEYAMPERSSKEEKSSECRKELESLRSKIKGRYQILSSTKDFETSMLQKDFQSNWRIKGSLMAHLHEHKSSVTKLAPLTSSGSIFASASTDGTVRLWDCSKLDGCQSINRSSQNYSAKTPIYSLAACDGGQSLAVGGKDGTLLLLRIDLNSSKMALQAAKHLDAVGEVDNGPVIDMHPLDHGSQSLIVYTTLYGGIVCWDLRMPENAWRLSTALRNGVITTFCIDPTSSWLATGTSIGKHSCYDLRFRLPIAEIQHPHNIRIRKVVPHPTEPSWLMSTAYGNNEISIWNIETGHRQGAIWASHEPPLSNIFASNKKTPSVPPGAPDPSVPPKMIKTSTVCGIVSGTIDRLPFIYTGGNDLRLRYWDLTAIDRTSADPRIRYLDESASKNCSLVVPSPRDNLDETVVTYDSRIIDGTAVLFEINTAKNPPPENVQPGVPIPPRQNQQHEETPRAGPDPPNPGHNDLITNLLFCKTPKQICLASSSRDGVIKLWK